MRSAQQIGHRIIPTTGALLPQDLQPIRGSIHASVIKQTLGKIQTSITLDQTHLSLHAFNLSVERLNVLIGLFTNPKPSLLFAIRTKVFNLFVGVIKTLAALNRTQTQTTRIDRKLTLEESCSGSSINNEIVDVIFVGVVPNQLVSHNIVGRLLKRESYSLPELMRLESDVPRLDLNAFRFRKPTRDVVCLERQGQLIVADQRTFQTQHPFGN